MTDLAGMRCCNHPGREAAARCVSCGSFCCRECSTEHDGRMTCANCLVQGARPTPAGGVRRALVSGVPFLAGFLLIWLFCYLFGKGLISLPSSFHEGTLWNSTPNSP
jgi:hypothetical protein